MKKNALMVYGVCVLLATSRAWAEDAKTKPSSSSGLATVTAKVEPAPVAAPASPTPAAVPSSPAPVTPAISTVPPVPTEAAENLEFVSGEITAIDEANKTITLKLYGEAESGAAEKALTIKVDDSTDITDGEKDRALKSCVPGTEVDVEYDPSTKKATYIFVY